MKVTSRYLPLAVVVVMLVIISLAMTSTQEGHAPKLEEKPMPPFSLELLEPAVTADETLFTGQWQLLNVWASWCGICKSEHGFLMQLAHQGEVSIVGLNYRDNRQSALRELTQSGNPYQAVLYDPKGSLALDLGVYGTPESYLIDSQGMIRYRYLGALDEGVWLREFVPVIELLQQEVQQEKRTNG
ncbi:DsbE family thiol:disulfide interchange protein [Photobacterium lutimaris]|uniref:Thiol:disulfide interchange protein n=1 Tax=Photobacterium lutimaris TaxID=388278 RepID=A0A2T3IZQ4_9GAMM|nr:DsbE family thiol:disulfide interchange protein [Photobacterium lutimaris]PSU34181.1 thiol:disulfide interchange protein [Photobacterium lutimaris]TDR75760.1 cytochrome c biogenesis protein CcmG/thiol:disulfide interchange protein DsbE [Photobacterium lutimaris]